MSGHGISHQHRKDKEDDEPLGITVSLDYCFITAEEQEKNVCPVLIMWDANMKSLGILPVVRKGAEEIVTKWACDRLDESGYRGTKITIKSDQEEAVLALKKGDSGDARG